MSSFLCWVSACERLGPLSGKVSLSSIWTHVNRVHSHVPSPWDTWRVPSWRESRDAVLLLRETGRLGRPPGLQAPPCRVPGAASRGGGQRVRPMSVWPAVGGPEQWWSSRLPAHACSRLHGSSCLQSRGCFESRVVTSRVTFTSDRASAHSYLYNRRNDCSLYAGAPMCIDGK